jgi:hypothetical protein
VFCCALVLHRVLYVALRLFVSQPSELRRSLAAATKDGITTRESGHTAPPACVGRTFALAQAGLSHSHRPGFPTCTGRVFCTRTGRAFALVKAGLSTRKGRAFALAQAGLSHLQCVGYWRAVRAQLYVLWISLRWSRAVSHLRLVGPHSVGSGGDQSRQPCRQRALV